MDKATDFDPAEQVYSDHGNGETSTRETYVYEAIANQLASYGARMCFGVSGTCNFKLSHALIKAGIEFVATRHECNAASMADAYARATGELTLVSVHAGPGFTNAITGIGEAAKSRTPLLVLAGDVSVSDITSTFYMDQAQAARSVGATPFRISSAASSLAETARAVTCALRERRTVVLTLPMDIQYETFPGSPEPLRLPPPAAPAAPDADTVAKLTELLASARRPLILAGRGAVLADSGKTLSKLAERCGALLATTLQANGLFAGNPWSLGICGGFATQAAADIAAQADLVIGFGASFTYWTTRHGRLFGEGTKVVQVDIDASRLGYQRSIDMAVLADVEMTAQTVLAGLETTLPTGKTGWRISEIEAAIPLSTPHALVYDDRSTGDYFDPRSLSKEIDNILPPSRMLALDAGHFMSWPPRFLRIEDAKGSCMGAAFQSIGLGIGMAIGLAMSDRERLTVLGIGDGGYMMSLADLETAVRLGLDMCIVIYDDAAYSAEVHPFFEQGFDIDFVKFPDLDLAGIARSVGAKGIVARTMGDLVPLREWTAAGAKGVFVIDAKIDPTYEEDWHIHATRRKGH